MTTYAELATRGCTCGDANVSPCPLHGPGDNRGIAAWFKAGMPLGFPMTDCTCAVCETGGCLIYPDIELEHGKGKMPMQHHPTLICPRCSVPASEHRLVAEAEAAGYVLNDARVFGEAVAA